MTISFEEDFGERTHIGGYPIDLTYRMILQVMSGYEFSKEDYDFIIDLSHTMIMINKYVKHNERTPIERQEMIVKKWLSLINRFEEKYGSIMGNIEHEIELLRALLAHTEDVSERKELEMRLENWLSIKIQIRP